jgi:predicted dehydrogenase
VSTSVPIRWGVVGCGQIAVDKALPALAAAATANLVALADHDAARLEHASRRCPGARAYGSVDDLLDDPQVQAVYIATPNHTHAGLAVRAAAAGKHVLVEKPMAMNADEGRQMVAAADRAGTTLMVAYMTLFNPLHDAARELIAGGAVGTPVFVRGRHSYLIAPASDSDAAAWRLDDAKGGGPLMDVALYPAITIRELTGQRIASVSATATTTMQAGRTDSVVFTFLLDDGTPGVIEGSFTHDASLVEIEGSRGRLVLRDHFSQTCTGVLELVASDPQTRLPVRMRHETVPDGTAHDDSYRREIEHFCDCVINGGEPQASGRTVLAELVVADAVRASLERGCRVTIDWSAEDLATKGILGYATGNLGSGTR